MTDNMRELLNTQLNVSDENTNKESYSSNEQIVQRENVAGTPFTIITTAGHGKEIYKWNGKEEIQVTTDGDMSFGTLGKYRITHNRVSKSEVRDELTDFSWDTVMKLLAIIIPEEVNRVLTQKQKN